MTRWGIALGISFALGAAVLLSGCDRSPVRPAPAGPAIARLEVTGPESIAPGASAQYRAVAHASNGTSRDVSTEAVWHSSHAATLSVSAGGLGTGRELGEATVNAVFNSTRGSRAVLVLPPDTFRLTGRVMEADTPQAIAAARIEAVAGTGSAVSTVSLSDGRYRLYGVPSDAELRVSSEGYQTHVQRVLLHTHENLDIGLTLAHPRPELAGTYALTLTAGADCSSALPGEARSRHYTALLAQTGARVEVTLQGGTFLKVGYDTQNRFWGDIQPAAPGRVMFRLKDFSYDDIWYPYYANVIEQLTPTTFFVPVGSVNASVTPTGLSGVFAGFMEIRGHASAPGQQFRTIASCHSTAHQFVLAR
jgi:hypothetical protein